MSTTGVTYQAMIGIIRERIDEGENDERIAALYPLWPSPFVLTVCALWRELLTLRTQNRAMRLRLGVLEARKAAEAHPYLAGRTQ